MRFVKAAGVPEVAPSLAPRINHADTLYGESTLPVLGAIVLIRTSDEGDALAFRGFNQQTLAGHFTMNAVQIDAELSAADNSAAVLRALDDSAGLLVIVMHDHAPDDQMKCEIENMALAHAAKREIPTLLVVPSWDHLYRRQLGLVILGNVRGAFMHFRKVSRTNTMPGSPRHTFKKVDEQNVLYWPRWQGMQPVRSCLRRIVRRQQPPKK